MGQIGLKAKNNNFFVKKLVFFSSKGGLATTATIS